MSALAQRAYDRYFAGNEWYSSDIFDETETDGVQADTNIFWTCSENAYTLAPITKLDSLHLTGSIVEIGVRIPDFCANDFSQFLLGRTAIGAYQVGYKKLAQRLSSKESADPLSVQFKALVDQWKHDTEIASSADVIVKHPAYQQIISFGPAALPLILRELEVNGGHWGFALKMITGISPIKPEDAGRIAKIRDAWLDWGRENSII